MTKSVFSAYWCLVWLRMISYRNLRFDHFSIFTCNPSWPPHDAKSERKQISWISLTKPTEFWQVIFQGPLMATHHSYVILHSHVDPDHMEDACYHILNNHKIARCWKMKTTLKSFFTNCSQKWSDTLHHEWNLEYHKRWVECLQENGNLSQVGWNGTF